MSVVFRLQKVLDRKGFLDFQSKQALGQIGLDRGQRGFLVRVFNDEQQVVTSLRCGGSTAVV